MEMSKGPPPEYTLHASEPSGQYGQYVKPAFIWCNNNFQDYLTNAASFHVQQKVELAEILYATKKKYTVFDQAQNKIFYVGEESECLTRQIFGRNRPFMLTVKDGASQDVLIMERELNCSFYGLFCPDKIRISTPTGQLLGMVVEKFSLYPTFDIRDAMGNTVLTIKGPLCPVACGPCSGPVVFDVKNLFGTNVGKISKEWTGWVQEMLTEADNFNISFPFDLDPSIKAVLLAALFLIDFEFFENP